MTSRAFESNRSSWVGRSVAENGQPAGSWPEPTADPTAVLRPPVVDLEALDLRDGRSLGTEVRVIGLVPGQIVTEQLVGAFARRTMTAF